MTPGLPSPGADAEPYFKTPVSWIYQEGGTADTYLDRLLSWSFSVWGKTSSFAVPSFKALSG